MDILTILELIISVLLIVSIILQNRGSSIGTAFGGTGETYRSKRGLEKLFFYATIVFAALFAGISLLLLVSH